MPKLKTHRGTAKRVRTTSTGKIIRRRSFGNHFLADKTGSRKRVIGTPAEVTGKNSKNIKRALGV